MLSPYFISHVYSGGNWFDDYFLFYPILLSTKNVYCFVDVSIIMQDIKFWLDKRFIDII